MARAENPPRGRLFVPVDAPTRSVPPCCLMPKQIRFARTTSLDIAISPVQWPLLAGSSARCPPDGLLFSAHYVDSNGSGTSVPLRYSLISARIGIPSNDFSNVVGIASAMLLLVAGRRQVSPRGTRAIG